MDILFCLEDTLISILSQKEMLNPTDHRFNPELDFHYTNVGVA